VYSVLIYIYVIYNKRISSLRTNSLILNDIYSRMEAVAEHLVGQGMAAAIPQTLLRGHKLNFGLDYLGKILTLLGIRISTVLKPLYLDFDPPSAAGWR
jgi:hypothetical protein